MLPFILARRNISSYTRDHLEKRYFLLLFLCTIGIISWIPIFYNFTEGNKTVKIHFELMIDILYMNSVNAIQQIFDWWFSNRIFIINIFLIVDNERDRNSGRRSLKYYSVIELFQNILKVWFKSCLSFFSRIPNDFWESCKMSASVFHNKYIFECSCFPSLEEIHIEKKDCILSNMAETKINCTRGSYAWLNTNKQFISALQILLAYSR